MGRRILLLSAPFGSGHLQAAHAVAQACEQLCPGAAAESVELDSPLLRGAARGYMTLLKRAPGVFRRLYHAPVGAGTRRIIRTALMGPVRREIARLQPDAVVATHPFPVAAAAHLRGSGELTAPVHVVLTDFAPHPLWIHAGIDRYFVASVEAARRLQVLGVNPERISATGIPIQMAFSGAAVQGVSTGGGGDLQGRGRVLVMGGGLGLGPIVEAVRSLAMLPERNLAITVVCGRNEPLRQELADLFGHDDRVAVLGFTDQVPALMMAADLLVTKPGGISCSEALACGLPMLLLAPLPGHEEENAEYLVRTGAARVVDDGLTGRAAAAVLFGRAERLARLREAALTAGRGQAAAMVANEIFIFPEPNRHMGTTA